MRGLYTSAD